MKKNKYMGISKVGEKGQIVIPKIRQNKSYLVDKIDTQFFSDKK